MTAPSAERAGTRADAGNVTGASLSVVIPVYNEEAILDDTIRRIVIALRADGDICDFEVIVCENGSTDGTRDLARACAGRHTEVRLLESDVADYGAAMRDGFRAAGGAYIVNFDADYYDLNFVSRALAVDADIVVAAKGIADSADRRSVLRRFVSRCFSMLVRLVLGIRTSETHGMKVFRRAAIEPILPHVHATKDLFDTELLARAERRGLVVVELPITTEEMRHSRSGIFRRIPRTLWGLAVMRRRLRREGRSRPRPVMAAAPPADHLARLVSGEAGIEPRLLVPDGAAVAIRDAEEALVGLDAARTAVLVALLPRVTPAACCHIADELDRIAQVGAAGIWGPDQAADLDEAHAAFFGAERASGSRLASDQRAVVVVRAVPDTDAWEELLVEVGGHLAGVYHLEGDGFRLLEIPDELLAPRPRLRAGRGALGVLALAVAFAAGLLVGRGGGGQAGGPGGPAVRDVVTGVQGAPTHNWWIGQDRLVQASDGTMLAVYGTPDGLQIVADHTDRGRAWQPPAVVPSIRATSASVALDAADRLHVAFSDGERVGYATVQGAGGRWTSSTIVELDAGNTTPYVDIAYDGSSGTAHVVWVAEGPGGQAPQWAAVGPVEGVPRVLRSAPLAEPAAEIPVLVNVAAGPDSAVVATYRRGDSPAGWYLRELRDGPPAARGAGQPAAWGPQEAVLPDASIGAADVAVDRSGVTHLVLRDSTGFALVYLTRSVEGEWSGAETAVDAESIEEIDFPSLTLDRTSRLVHLFFQTDRDGPAGGIRFAVRDPALGWGAPSPVAAPAAVPDGASLPTSASQTSGAPVVLWTSGADPPALQAAAVAP